MTSQSSLRLLTLFLSLSPLFSSGCSDDATAKQDASSRKEQGGPAAEAGVDQGGSPKESWQISCKVNLGGEFDVEATAEIAVSGTTFDAAVRTSKIGGATEELVIAIKGTVEGQSLVVKDHTFEVEFVTQGQTVKETVTLSGTVNLTGSSMSGSGDVTVVQSGNTETGTFTLTGTKS